MRKNLSECSTASDSFEEERGERALLQEVDPETDNLGIHIGEDARSRSVGGKEEALIMRVGIAAACIAKEAESHH